jgi:monoamine oxidase
VDKMGKLLHRRGVLGALGLGAIGAAGAMAAPAAPPVATGDDAYDVVILGAGFAGITASRELGRAGYRCLVLEARNRLGGRTFSTEVFGQKGEVGGQWVHWIQPHIWSEITRYGMNLAESPGANPASMGVMVAGKLQKFSPAVGFPILTTGMKKVFPDAATLFPRPFDPYFNADFLKLDGLSLADRMRSTKLTAIERAMLEAFFTTAISGSPAKGGLLDQMHWFSRADSDADRLLRACSQFKMAEGTASLLGHMVADGKPEIRLSTVVSRVEQKGDLVYVTSEDGVVAKAHSCVVALPMNCWSDIEWLPALLPQKLAASKERHAGTGYELHIKVSGSQPAYFGMAPAGNPINTLYTDHIGPEQTVMIGMGTGIDKFDINDDAQIATALKTLMPGAKLLETYAYDWNSDPYSKGTWCNYTPNMWSRYGLAMRKTEGRLVFAGSDVANGWRGFIDGAIETGLRAAGVVQQILHKD